MNNLIVKSICIPEDNAVLAAKASLDLWVEEIKRAEEARKEADKKLRTAIANNLNATSLKAIEGELIRVINYDLMYFYHDNTWKPFPLLEDL